MSERDLPEYVTPAELLDVVGDDLEAVYWLHRLVPENKAEAAEFYREHWPNILRGFEELRQRFEGGDGATLLEAVKMAAELRVPMPEWVTEGFGRAWGRFTEAEARTLGDAFGVARPMGWTREAERKKGYLYLICERSKALRAAGLRTDRNRGSAPTVFEQIAKELASPKTLTDRDNPAPDPIMAAIFKPTGWVDPLHVTATWVRDNLPPGCGPEGQEHR